MSLYVQVDYIETTDQGLYFEGDVTTVRGGSTTWADCPSWATWPQSRWSPGIGPAQLNITASATGVRVHPGQASASLTMTASSTGKLIHGGSASADITSSAVAQGNVIFGGIASANLTMTASILAGVIHPPYPHTTFSVLSETRIYVLPEDPDNRLFAIPFEDSESRIYPVGYESRTRTIESETRIQPTEVY